MARIVRGGLIQATNPVAGNEPVKRIKQAMIEKHVKLIAQAAKKGVQVLCMQEIFYGPYFCCEQELKWYESTERVPAGPTVKLMQQLAKKHSMVLVVPVYEEEATGTYYNTAAVIDADGKFLGKYRKNHIPHCKPGFWEKFYFKPGNLGYPVFDTAVGKVGVYICYDRHFPEGWRQLGLLSGEAQGRQQDRRRGCHLWQQGLVQHGPFPKHRLASWSNHGRSCRRRQQCSVLYRRHVQRSSDWNHDRSQLQRG